MTAEIPTQDLQRQAIDKFWESVPPAWNQIKNHLRSIAGDEFGVSVEQFHILRHIRKGLGSVSELAEVKQISRPAISQLVNALVEKGLIDRCPSDSDRRCIHLELTPDGDRLLNTIFEKNRRWMAEKFEALDPEETRQMIHGLELLKRSFEENLS